MLLARSKAFKSDGKRNDEQDFDIEQEKDDGNGVELDGKAVAGRRRPGLCRIRTASIHRRPFARADKLRDQKLAHAKPGRDKEHDPDRCIIHQAEIRHLKPLPQNHGLNGRKHTSFRKP